MQLQGKVAVVTGGSSGIGRAAALAFAREGAKVVIADVDIEGSRESVGMIEAAGGEACFIRCDISNAGEVEVMVQKTVDMYGSLDCAFNNAGIEGISVSIADYPLDMWNKVLSVNLTGVFLCMKYEIQQMLKQGGGGAIVNNASILGVIGFANASAYTAAKHGVLGLTKVAAMEYASKGIRVNSVCPAFIATPMLERAGITSNPETAAMLAGMHPVRRMGRPEEIGEIAMWLCTDAASFVHGHGMLVDGGYVAQ